MLLAVDIGNTSTKFGIFDGEHLLSKFAIPTAREQSADELRSLIKKPISKAIICSVVPKKEKQINDFLNRAFEIDPFIVSNDLDFGIKITYQPLSALGTDRLVNSFAAVKKYGTPCIVCSIGTATTFDVVDRDHELLGGVIAPGMKTMTKALHINTAKLPDIKVEKPERTLGNTTASSIQSGIFYGHIAMIEGMIKKIKKEIDDNPKVIATGGFAPMIAENTTLIDIIDENLLLDGLRLLHERIQPA